MRRSSARCSPGASATWKTSRRVILTLIGTDAFSSTAGELRYDFQGGDCYLQVDTNGDAVSDYMIRLVGVTTLDSDFFFL
jgi:hypothetical protein